jgi:hypothetical protein
MGKWLYYKPRNNAYIEMPDGRGYVVSMKNNIPLVEVDENSIGHLLLKRCGCCGNSGPCFRIATEDEVKKYLE